MLLNYEVKLNLSYILKLRRYYFQLKYHFCQEEWEQQQKPSYTKIRKAPSDLKVGVTNQIKLINFWIVPTHTQ